MPKSRPRTNMQQIVAKAMRFHRFCENHHCRRARACRAEGQPCFSLCWPHVPEHVKELLRTTILTRAGGASIQESVAAGEAASARRLAFDAAARARQTPPPVVAPAPPSPEPPRERPLPRIRSL